MKFDIINRWTRDVQFTAEIDCDPTASVGVKIGLAVKWARTSGADLSGVPRINKIHSTIYAAASSEGALDMSSWHCGTSHCRAGWVVTLAGDGGKALEWAMGTPAAAAIIYMASDPNLDRIPDFYCDNSTALADMKRLADAETIKAGV